MMGSNLSSEAKASSTHPQSEPVQRVCPVLTDEQAQSVYKSLKDTAENPTARNNDPLSDRNSIPTGLHNRPMTGQQKPLSIERISSTIPKGERNDTWTYPSAQMFFNALKRKGKGDDVIEDDMDFVVQAHNTLNEKTWRHIQQWESLHSTRCTDPKLIKFRGRPDTLSPKAWFVSLYSDSPFDRHDWVVDRCGENVRYVIDFYFKEEKAGRPEAFVVDARPALDSFGAVHDRVKMSIYRVCARLGLPCPITGHSTS